MKRYLKYILIVSLLPFALSGNAKKQQSEEQTIDQQLEESQAKLDSIQSIVKELEQKKQGLQDQINANKKDSVRLSMEITKVQGAIEYIGEDPNKEQKIVYADLTQKLNEYKNTMVELSIRSLSLPYDEFYIEEVAIPYFEKGKGSEAYISNEYRGKMLKNYGKDWNNLKKFLIDNKNTTYTSAGSVKEKLLKFPTYVQYASGINPNTGNKIPGYGPGWEHTYLGNIMYNLYNVLNSASDPTDTPKIKQAFETYLNWMK